MFSDTGLIWVESSVYGRTDHHTCNVNLPASQVANTNCAVKISTIANRYGVSWLLRMIWQQAKCIK